MHIIGETGRLDSSVINARKGQARFIVCLLRISKRDLVKNDACLSISEGWQLAEALLPPPPAPSPPFLFNFFASEQRGRQN